MNEAFALSMPWWTFALRGVAAYLVLLLMLRLTGKRSLGDMSAFDIVVLIMVGGTLRTAILGDDKSFLGPLIGVAGILAMDKAIGWLGARWTRFNRWVEGVPSILARDGRRDPQALRRHDIADTEFDRELHAAGLEDESSVRIARLEPNGKVTFIRQRETQDT